MTKNEVLYVLKQAKDYVSGEKISGRLGISRAAVNAAVNSLRDEGYEIASRTNKGYRLIHSPDLLNMAEIGSHIGKERATSVICLESVDSTNVYLTSLANGGAPDGQTVIANEQTNGKGRRGRSFSSPKDKGIYMSVLVRPEYTAENMVSLSSYAAVAVRTALENVCGLCCKIKWVNDIVYGKKKLCGILTEMSVEGESGCIRYAIIGIGINVSEEEADFAGELADKATSVMTETKKKYSRAEIASEIIKQLDIMRGEITRNREKYLSEYRKHSATIGREVAVLLPQGERRGFAEGINDNFSLVVRFDDGKVESLSSGEVSVRGVYGYV